MVDETAAFGAIALLALTTVATRFAGVWIMSYVTISPRVTAFLRAMAPSVLIAIVVPATWAAAPRIWLAVAASVVVMLATRSALGAMIAGAMLAALARNLGY